VPPSSFTGSRCGDSDAEADAYFATRARDSRIGAWASLQSQPLESRDAFMARVAEIDARYPGDTVPRPPHWSGFRVRADRIELWQDVEYRLHERRVFIADGSGSWTSSMLYP
jgi:pyridoxamine 5'-phosphate oxidase